jgi:hypothetical protein
MLATASVNDADFRTHESFKPSLPFSSYFLLTPMLYEMHYTVGSTALLHPESRRVRIA